MSAFSDLRVTLAADMAGMGVPVTPSWPLVLDPPCGFITPPLAADYVQQGPMFGEHTVSLDLVLLVEHGEADAALAALEELVQYALVNTADWTLIGVDAPGPTSVSESGADYLASVIHLSKPVRMGA